MSAPVITHLLVFVLGMVAGALITLKNTAKVQALEDRIKALEVKKP